MVHEDYVTTYSRISDLTPDKSDPISNVVERTYYLSVPLKIFKTSGPTWGQINLVSETPTVIPVVLKISRGPLNIHLGYLCRSRGSVLL